MLYYALALVAIPIAAACLLLALGSSARSALPRWVALGSSVVAMVLAAALASEYYQTITLNPDPAVAAARAAGPPVNPAVEYRRPWLSFETRDPDGFSRQTRLELFVGLDGVSVALIALTALLGTSCVLISWNAIQERTSEYYVALLMLQAGLFGVFCAYDVILFYVFFEFTLIPLFFLIAMWGGPQRRIASVKFFLYTLAGSLITLLAGVWLVGLAAASGLETPTSLPDLAGWVRDRPEVMSTGVQTTLFLMLIVGFLIKVPVFPFHTWLPLAHVEAPTAGSVLLAGVLLKLGSYGFFRVVMALLPAACIRIGVPLIATLSVIGIIYGSMCALVQRDVKKLVAYSSVAHMGFCMLGLFALNVEGMSGGVLQMINHGLSTGGLFLLVGMIYDRYHTRMLDDIGGLAARLPYIACFLVFISMASIGLPGLNGFVGEVLALAGMFKSHPLYAVLGATGVVLGAWYLLTMLQHLLFGPLKEPHALGFHGHAPVRDMNLRELLAIAPIAAACLFIGVRPQPLLNSMRPEIEALARLYADQRAEGSTAAIEPAGAPPTLATIPLQPPG
ncbi:MAG TPA: NADH-quinone oxidoreductase subunit M [Lacipirellulaceae bacterium]|nr:NADH-quinone oxidoreductase subunit M [Lacipirellulaceae bacterium]